MIARTPHPGRGSAPSAGLGLILLLLLCGCGDDELLYPNPQDRVHPGAGCGACLTRSGSGAKQFGSEASLRALWGAAKLGLDRVSVTGRGVLPSGSSTGPITLPTAGEADTLDLLRLDTRRAVQLGLTVMVKPHLEMGDGSWRGDIQPGAISGAWDAWFAAYEAFLLPFARMAEEEGAHWLCIGVELASSSESQGSRWRALIKRVRGVFSGKLVYGANWDEVARVSFWDALDAVGVQMFAPLTRGELPDQAKVTDGADYWLAHYESVAQAAGKPLVLTEVGYINRPKTAEKPWIWPQDLGSQARSAAGDEAQRRAYLAIIRTFGQSPQLSDIYWWQFYTDPDYTEPGDVGFAPRGPARAVLEQACAR